MNNKYNKIKEQRKSLAYSIRELASLANIQEKDIVAYEANKKNASLKTLEKIADATNTKVCDWVGEDYFKKSKDLENIPYENNTELALTFFQAMFRADDVMETIYNALIDMREIELTKDNEVVISEFGKKICLSIASIKLKKIMVACGRDTSKDISTDNNIERTNDCIKKKKRSIEDITYNDLLEELKILYRNTDIIEIIIQALINIGYIDDKGSCSENAKSLLTTIMSNKVKSLVDEQ